MLHKMPPGPDQLLIIQQSYGYVASTSLKFVAFMALNLKMLTIPALENRSTITDAQENTESMELTTGF
jgi:hypothetical protein